ncbi:MAG: hypothetical protein R3C26_02495 [Calditrichia bacterium]
MNDAALPIFPPVSFVIVVVLVSACHTVKIPPENLREDKAVLLHNHNRR